MPTQLTFDDTCARLLAAVPALAKGAFAPAGDIGLREVPGWIREFGALRDGASLWLWLAGAPGLRTRGSEPAMGQAVIDVPEGRYRIDTYDVDARAWVSRESALAAPLVIGVPHRAGAVLVRIRLQAD